MATTEERVSNLDKGFDLLGTRLVNLYQQVDAGFKQMNARFETIDRRFDKLEKLITDGFSKNGA